MTRAIPYALHLTAHALARRILRLPVVLSGDGNGRVRWEWLP